MAEKKPVIVLVNPEPGGRAYWRENLEVYLKSQGVSAEIREAGEMGDGKGTLANALLLIHDIIREGKRPALLITDARFDYIHSGGHLVRHLRDGAVFEDQDILWPEGRELPAVVASGAMGDASIGYANTIGCSSICLGQELNNPKYNGFGKPIIAAFKKFVNNALGLPPPQQSTRRA